MKERLEELDELVHPLDLQGYEKESSEEPYIENRLTSHIAEMDCDTEGCTSKLQYYYIPKRYNALCGLLCILFIIKTF